MAGLLHTADRIGDVEKHEHGWMTSDFNLNKGRGVVENIVFSSAIVA